MRWRDNCWSAYNWFKNTSVDIVANSFDTLGSLACIASGIGSTFNTVLDEIVKASYFASINTVGEVEVEASLSDSGYHYNNSFPLQKEDKIDGGLTYNLMESINPYLLRVISIALLVSGGTLRIVSANLKMKQQNRRENEHFQERAHFDVSRPTWGEYFYVSAEALFGSLSYAFLTGSVVAATIYGYKTVGTYLHITYPDHGDPANFTTGYNGPTTSYVIPFQYEFRENITVNTLYFELVAQVVEKIKATVNITYGGEAFFTSRVKARPTIAVPMGIGVGCYLASRFFGHKAENMHNDRMFRADDDFQALDM